MAPLDIIKLCQSLRYQSCERAAWDQSFAKDFLNRVISAAIGALSGYNAAFWGTYLLGNLEPLAPMSAGRKCEFRRAERIRTSDLQFPRAEKGSFGAFSCLAWSLRCDA